MTQVNIQNAIRDYLNKHLELIPQLQKDGITDAVIIRISMVKPFVYEGQGECGFIGEGEGWISTIDDGKSIRHFKTQTSIAMILEGDENPIVKSVNGPIIFY